MLGYCIRGSQHLGEVYRILFGCFVVVRLLNFLEEGIAPLAGFLKSWFWSAFTFLHPLVAYYTSNRQVLVPPFIPNVQFVNRLENSRRVLTVGRIQCMCHPVKVGILLPLSDLLHAAMHLDDALIAVEADLFYGTEIKRGLGKWRDGRALCGHFFIS